jgi:lysophospholipase L1-like esterase
MEKDNSSPQFPTLRGKKTPRIVSREALARLGLLSAALAIMIVGGEFAARVGYRALNNYDMEMWRYAREMKRLTGDPALPFVNRPSASGRYYGVEIRTNALGCRSAELATEKGGHKRLLFLGDSFTLGFGVPANATFTTLVQQKLADAPTPFEVVNAGVGNYNSLMEFSWLKKHWAAVQPDAVVLMFYLNDVEVTPRIGGIGFLLARHSYLYAVLADRYRKLMTRIGRDRYTWRTYYSRLYDDDNPGLALNRQALREMAELCRERKVPLVAVNIPDIHQLQPYPFPRATRYLEQACAENGVPFVDLLPALQPHDPAGLWVSPEDTHTNAAADRIIADAVFGALCRLGIVPCGML